MKKIILILSLLAINSASAELIKVNSPLKNKEIIIVIDEVLTDIFENGSKELFSSFDGIIKEARIIEITKKEKKVNQIKVKLIASFSTYDYDFGDPVDELIETECIVKLSKGLNGKYTKEGSISSCDQNTTDYLY